MPKIKLKKKENYEFEYKIILKNEDINSANHLGNDRLITLINKARVNIFNKLGVSEENIGDNKTGIIIADLGVNYINEAFLFDKIIIKSHIDEISKKSFRIFHQVSNKNKIIALIETGIVAFDYKNKTIAEIPDFFINSLKEYFKK